MKNDSLKDLEWGFATKAIHAGFKHDPSTGAIMPPICLSSTFAQKSPGEPLGDYEYSRTANPTRDILQANLAALEQGKFALCFASGCAAFSTLLQTLKPGSHVVVNDDIYGGTRRLLDIFSSHNIQFTQCDLSKPSQLETVLQDNTRLIWIETPSNPLLKITDIEAIHSLRLKLAPHVLLAVDNTFATPFLQNPLTHGADIVCHSTTKYIGGHSDIIGGTLILNQAELAEKLFFLQNALGAIPSPMDCFLLLRSIKTLSVRMAAHCYNAKLISDFLQEHPKVKSVIYPGLSSHPGHTLALRQMRDFGGMITIILQGEKKDAIQFLQKVKLFTLAESLGGVESLIEHPATMTHAAIPLEHRRKIGIEDTLIRLSVGIEDAKDLIADLEQALNF